MRKIVAIEWLSLDGYISGPAGQTDWFSWNKDVENHYKKMLENIDQLLFGRKTYELMADYWPTEKASGEDPFLTHQMNKVQKIVYSKNIENTPWNNSLLHSNLDFTEIRQLKNLPGKDIVIFGSNSIVVQLAKEGLIDEYRLMINPIILGGGTLFFAEFNQRLPLKLTNSIKFDPGVLNYYRA
jgi:dihydrofolate reductase